MVFITFVLLFILWNTLIKKPLIKLLFLLRGFCNAFCNPRALISFSFYFNSNFRKIFVIGFKKYIKEVCVCSVWIVQGLNDVVPFNMT